MRARPRVVDIALLTAVASAVYLLWDLRTMVQRTPPAAIRIEYTKTFADGREPTKITIPKLPGEDDLQWQAELRRIARELEAFHE